MRKTIIDYPPLLERFGYLPTAICLAVIAIGIVALVSRRMVHSGAAAMMILAFAFFGLAEFARQLYNVSTWYLDGDAPSPYQLIGDFGAVNITLTGLMAACGLGFLLVALSVFYTRDSTCLARKRHVEKGGDGNADGAV